MPSSTTSLMDFLSAIFFIVAGLWLLAAIFYSLMVFYFLRLRSHNLLHTIYDDEFGRLYLPARFCCWRRLNNNVDQQRPVPSDEALRPRPQLYMSFGWIFRRYARHLNIEIDGNDNNNRDAPRYKRSERREAVIVILQQQMKHHQRLLRPSSISSPLDNEPCLTINISRSRWFPSFKKINGATNEVHKVVITALQDSTAPVRDNHHVDLENRCASTTEAAPNAYCDASSSSLPMGISEAPICSICLGPYDDDNLFDNGDDQRDSGNLDSATAAASSTIFLSATCRHQFHMECIVNWLQRKTNTECPCCRIPIIDDKKVWKTIQQLRKQKRQLERKKQQKRHLRATDSKQQPNNEPIDETTNSETEQDV